MREEPSRKHIMTTRVTWYGTQEESFDLVNAVARNCACEFGLMGVRLTTCAPHQMLVEDQRALNGLLFARSIADRLKAEEWSWGEPIPERAGEDETLEARSSEERSAQTANAR